MNLRLKEIFCRNFSELLFACELKLQFLLKNTVRHAERLPFDEKVVTKRLQFPENML